MLNTGLSLLAPTDWQGVVLRLGLALLSGGLIGLERELDRKPAGLRTHMLVSLGSAIFVLIGTQTGMAAIEPNTLSRIIQGLLAGVGFLGAGEIFSASKTEPLEIKIQGLTSAAAIWVSAALGTASGCGLWFISLTAAAMTLIVLWGVKKLEKLLKMR